MKKLFTILILMLCFTAFAQDNLQIETIKIESGGRIYGTESGAIDSLISHDSDNIGLFKIKNVTDPVFDLDAVNKKYVDSIAGADSTQKIDFWRDAILPHREGRMFYDTLKKTVAYYNEIPDVRVNLGQEVLFPVINETGGVITNGTLVQLSGAGSSLAAVGVGIADASVTELSRAVAMATHDIGIEEIGYVTRIGDVGGLNTSGFNENDKVYLSATNPGEWTTVKPDDGGYVVFVGVVKYVDAFEGVVTVDTRSSELTAEITDTNGYPPSEVFGTTITFTDLTRTFEIAPTGAEFYYYQLGDKFEKSTPQSVVISDVTGLHIIYFDGEILFSLANPTQEQVADIIINKVFTAYIYWNATDDASYSLGEERHGISMSPATHAYLHATFGARYLSGLGLTDIITDATGSLDSHAQFGVGSGVIVDEDIFNSLSPYTSTTGLPIYYKTGVSGEWKRVFQAGFSVFNTGSASGRPFYNQFTGGTWQLTEVPNNDFFLCHIFGTNDIDYGTITVMGEAEYATLTNAREGALTEILQLQLTNFPTPEFVPVATVIFQTSNGYTNTVKSRIRSTDLGDDYIDWRTSELIGGAGGGGTSQTYLDLDDTPFSYTGFSNTFVKINPSETGQEFSTGLTYGTLQGLLTIKNQSGINSDNIFEGKNFAGAVTSSIDGNGNLSINDLNATGSITEIYQQSVISNDDNNFPIPFVLKSASVVYWNGNILQASQWTGIGTSTLNVLLNTKQYDFITIIKN